MRQIARLTRGETVARPRVVMLDSEFLDGAQRERLRARLQRYVDGRIRADLAPLFAATEAAAADPEMRGPLHRLGETLGIIPGVDEETLAPTIRPKLRKIGVRSGRLALFVPAMLKPRTAAMRARLWALAHGLPVPGAAGRERGVDAGPARLAARLRRRHGLDGVRAGTAAPGCRRAGGRRTRLSRPGGERSCCRATSGHGCRSGPRLLPIILRHLGFRIVPGGGLAPEMFGPPAPAMLAPIRRRRPVADSACHQGWSRRAARSRHWRR